MSTKVKQARRLSGMMMRNISTKHVSIMVPLFSAIIRPVLEYGNAVWCPYKKKDIKKIEDVQRDYTRRIKGMNGLDYSERLQTLKLPSLEFRRLRGDLIEVYKILHNIYDPITTHSLLTIDSSSCTHSNGFKLTKPGFNTNPYKYFFTNRIVNDWNSLPSQVVNADSLNTFKNKIDLHFRDIMYKIYFRAD